MNANGAPVAQAAQAQHSLTRCDVYNQLVQAEKDSSLHRRGALWETRFYSI
jgi:hypothetical protein